MDDLSLVSTDDLLETLGARFDHWVFTGVQIRNRNNDGDGLAVTHRRFFGNNAQCLGLCRQMEHFLCVKHFDQDSEDIEE